MNRRDLLKFFGVGAVVAPVVGGVALASDHARLIEAPRVEVVKPAWDFVDPFEHLQSTEELDITVFMKGQRTGKVTRLDCCAFMARGNSTMVDVTMHGDMFRKLKPLMFTCMLEVTGEVRMAKKS